MRSPLLLLTTVAIVIGGAAGQSTGCNYYQEVAAGQTLPVFSPNYPQNYTGGVNCRWEAVAPSTSRLILTCNEFILPTSDNCVEDRFRVSPTGDATMSDAHTYCGNRTFSVTSTNNRMVITFDAPHYSNGSRFVCSLTANVPTTPKPQPCECGWRNQARIVNGQETGVNEFPMMAVLFGFENKQMFCGATIISSSYILTAAHCLINRSIYKFGVLVGEHDISTGSETNSSKLLRVVGFILHPNYNSVTQQDDIAVIRVVGYITFSLKVGPACLPFKYPTTPVGTPVYVLGWGMLKDSGPKPTRLMGTQLNIVDISICQQVYEDMEITTNQLCTFKNGTDACQGDSGGPVLWTDDSGRLKLLGVISYGNSCAEQNHGVDTRVYSYIQWIVSVTPDARYCVL